MADLLLSALVPIVVQKSSDILVKRISEMWGIAEERKKLEDKLLEVQDVLTDAEEQGDAKPSVKSWLAKMKSAAYDADDILDEFRYEELRRDAMRRGHKAGNVSGFFSLENPVLFRLKMSRKLKEVVGRIDELVTQMETFKFVQGRPGRAVDHVITHSYVIESEVEGRGHDSENLVKLLTEVHPAENLTVMPVVGMGGLGKTTLAQLAYNDPRIKENFKLLIWNQHFSAFLETASNDMFWPETGWFGPCFCQDHSVLAFPEPALFCIPRYGQEQLCFGQKQEVSAPVSARDGLF